MTQGEAPHEPFLREILRVNRHARHTLTHTRQAYMLDTWSRRNSHIGQAKKEGHTRQTAKSLHGPCLFQKLPINGIAAVGHDEHHPPPARVRVNLKNSYEYVCLWMKIQI